MTGTSTYTSHDDNKCLNNINTNSHPASCAVLGGDLSTAGRHATGSRSNLAAAYAEMFFLNGHQHNIAIELPALSPEQALQAESRRLSNPTAEAAALSAG